VKTPFVILAGLKNGKGGLVLTNQHKHRPNIITEDRQYLITARLREKAFNRNVTVAELAHQSLQSIRINRVASCVGHRAKCIINYATEASSAGLKPLNTHLKN